MATQSQDAVDNSVLFSQLDSYPWADDAEFQGGLQAILGSVQDPERIEYLTLRAKCYYYARKAGTPVDFDGYKQWVEQRQANSGANAPSAPAPTAQDAGSGGLVDAPKPASFAEICDMIAEGKPIPGIKDIPDTILEGQASESQASTRKKPWEKDASAAETPSWIA